LPDLTQRLIRLGGGIVSRKFLAWGLLVVAVALVSWLLWDAFLRPEKPNGPGPSPATQAAIQATENAVAEVQATVTQIKHNRPKHDAEVAKAREEAIQNVQGLDPRAVADRLNAHLARFRRDPLYPAKLDIAP
jgi:hypothetical protein